MVVFRLGAPFLPTLNSLIGGENAKPTIAALFDLLADNSIRVGIAYCYLLSVANRQTQFEERCGISERKQFDYAG